MFSSTYPALKEDLETNYWFHGKELYDYRVTHTGIGTTAKYSAIKKLEQTLGFFSSCDRFKSYDSYEML